MAGRKPRNQEFRYFKGLVKYKLKFLRLLRELVVVYQAGPM